MVQWRFIDSRRSHDGYRRSRNRRTRSGRGRHRDSTAKSQLTRSRVRAAWLFLAPMLIVLVLVAGWPLLRTIWFSFTDATLSDLG